MNKASQDLVAQWPLLLVAFLLVFVAFGIPTYSLQFIYPEAMEEFGWSNAQVNLLSTAKFLTGAVAALAMGILVDKLGGRWTVLVGTLAGGVAMALFFFATNLTIYYLAGVMLGFSGSSIVAAMKVIVARLFTINQGLAMGIVLTATSFGGVVIPWVWRFGLEYYNWRVIMAFFSLGTVVIAVPAWLFYMSRQSETRDIVAAASKPAPGARSLWGHFRAISSERGFWLIALGIFLVSAVDQALTQNHVLFLRNDRGIESANTIATATMMFALIGLIAKVGSGWVFDRMSIRGIAVFYALLSLSIFLALPVSGLATIVLFITIRGIAHGGMIVDVPILTRHYFGMERIGMTMGLMAVCVNLGFAAGPPVLGWFADTYGNFTMGMIVYGCLAAVATVLLLPVRPRYWTSPAERATRQSTTAEQAAAAAG
jgi:MFS family permease